MKHEIAYDDKGEIITLETPEKKLRELSSSGNLYINFKYKIKGIFASGDVMTAHFKLKNELFEIDGEYYRYNEPMSKYHRKIQEQLKDLFISRGVDFELEKPIKTTRQIADCYFEYNNQIYIIEVQRSRQSNSKYKERTELYKNLGFKVVWLVVPETDYNLNEKNFHQSQYYNDGEYFIILSEENYLDFNLIRKKREDGELLFEYCGFNEQNNTEDIINFFFKKDYGIVIDNFINLKRNKLEDLNYDLNNQQIRLKNIENTLNNRAEEYQHSLESEKRNKEITNQLLKQIDENEKILEILKTEINEIKNNKTELVLTMRIKLKNDYIEHLKFDDKDIQKLEKEYAKMKSDYPKKIENMKNIYKLWYYDLNNIKWFVTDLKQNENIQEDLKEFLRIKYENINKNI